jgi:Bacterial Ig-like domain (group 3)/Right handed beta helix region
VRLASSSTAPKSTLGRLPRRARTALFAATATILMTITVGEAPANASSGTTYFAGPTAKGTGDCSTAANSCSLSTAIGKTANGDGVVLADGTYSVDNLTISHGITLSAATGAAPTLEGPGDGDDDIVDVTSSAPVSLDGLTFTDAGSGNVAVFNKGGTVSVSNSDFLDNGYGIFNEGAATVTDSAFNANTDSGIQNGFQGNVGELTATGSTFTDNSTDGVFNGVGTATLDNDSFNDNVGSGIFNAARMWLDNSQLVDNTQDGLDEDGSATVLDSSIAGNGLDGIVLNDGAPATVTDSVIWENGTNGIDNGQGTLSLSDSTIAGNGADGVLTERASSSVIASTISANTGDGLDITTAEDAIVTTGADIVAGNTHASCSGPVTTDDGYDLAGDTSCGFTGTGSTVVDTVGDPYVLPLDDNGGPWFTMALASNAPAIDMVQGPLSDGLVICGTNDQRGLLRPTPECDAGAFESSPVPAAASVNLAVTPAGGATLGQVVTFDATVSGPHDPPTGTVTFTADGTPIVGCTNVAVSSGAATCPTAALGAGAFDLRARYSGDGEYAAGADEIPTYVVGRGATSTSVTAHSSSLSATVAAIAPASGTPSGTVTFSVDGVPIGTAALTGVEATLTHTLVGAHNVSASYSGDSQFNPSIGSTATANPTIKATLTSSTPKTRFGWYRSPVTVSFACSAGSAALITTCPKPVTVSASKIDQSVTATVTAADGGAASVTVSPINIDRDKPTVTVKGVISGHTYTKAPHLTCSGHDTLSGIGSCTLAQHVVKIAHLKVVTYTATATDRAGNTATSSGKYDVKASVKI